MPTARLSQSRLRLESLEHREVPATLTTGVDNDNYLQSRPTDWDGTDDLLSLKEAIRKVNKGADTVIDFNGLTVDLVNGTLPNITRTVTVKGGTLDGHNWASGLILRAGGTVRDMTFVRLRGAGLGVSGGSALVENNFIGTDANGTPGLGNATGLGVGTDSGVFRNNVISGNEGVGVGFGGNYNKLAGNKIGVAPDGVTPLPNGGPGVVTGVRSADDPVPQSYGNVIGGTTAGDRNVIAGFSEAGIIVSSNREGTRILGNYIGLDANGNVIPGGSNGDGILVEGIEVFDTVIGGPGAARNWIAGVDVGINIEAQYVTVIGNVVGLQADGTAPATDRNDIGIRVRSVNTVVGQPGAGYGNIVSGNAGAGIRLNLSGGNKVQNNWVGLDLAGKAGTAASPGTGNGGAGIEVLAAQANNIGGGSISTGNVIAGNEGPGLLISSGGSHSNRVRNNTIGLDASGALVTLTGGDRGNRGGGVEVAGGAKSNLIGEPGAGNVISGNTGAGVRITGQSPTQGVTTNNRVLANRIGTDRAGTQALGNGVGIVVEAPALENFIGDGTGTGRNLISGNLGDGIQINGGDGTFIRNNYIGTTATGTAGLGNGGDGLHILTGSGTRVVKNTIAFNGGFGIKADAGIGNTFDANSISKNGGEGISLTPLANAGIGEPVITLARRSSMAVRIEGLAATRPNSSLRVQLFGNPTARDDGEGEGARYLGTVKVTTDATGAFVAKFAFGVPVGFRVLTITVTDEDGNTSEFSDSMSV